MFSVPVFICILQISLVYSADTKFPGYNHQILEIDLNTLRGLLAEEKLGDNLKRSSSVNSAVAAAAAALTPVANAGSQNLVSAPSNSQYSSLPIPMYLRNPSPVKKSACENKGYRAPLAAASSAVSATQYGLSSASVAPVSSASVAQPSEVTRSRYATSTRNAYAESAVKPASTQNLSSQASVPTEYAKSTEIYSAETANNGASTVLAQAGYAAVSPNSHLAVAAQSASGYDQGNVATHGASIAKLPGLKPLAIDENQKGAFNDFIGAVENPEFKPLTNQDVQNLPHVSHAALTGGAVSSQQSQGGYKSYSNQGNQGATNYGANPNQGYSMNQGYNSGYSSAAAPPAYTDSGSSSGSSYGGLSEAQSYGGGQSYGAGQSYGGQSYYGSASAAPSAYGSGASYGVSSAGPNTQSYGGMQSAGQYFNAASSGVSQSYGYPSASYETADSQGWNTPLRAFIK